MTLLDSSSRRAPSSLLACLLAIASLSASAEGAPDRLDTGVIDPAALTSQSASLAFTRIRGAGATSVRIVLYWNWVAPLERPADFQSSNPADPAYRWALIDAQVKGAAAAGLQPILAISRAPRWARSTPEAAERPGQIPSSSPASRGRRPSDIEGTSLTARWLSPLFAIGNCGTNRTPGASSLPSFVAAIRSRLPSTAGC